MEKPTSEQLTPPTAPEAANLTSTVGSPNDISLINRHAVKGDPDEQVRPSRRSTDSWDNKYPDQDFYMHIGSWIGNSIASIAKGLDMYLPKEHKYWDWYKKRFLNPLNKEDKPEEADKFDRICIAIESIASSIVSYLKPVQSIKTVVANEMLITPSPTQIAQNAKVAEKLKNGTLIDADPVSSTRGYCVVKNEIVSSGAQIDLVSIDYPTKEMYEEMFGKALTESDQTTLLETQRVVQKFISLNGGSFAFNRRPLLDVQAILSPEDRYDLRVFAQMVKGGFVQFNVFECKTFRNMNSLRDKKKQEDYVNDYLYTVLAMAQLLSAVDNDEYIKLDKDYRQEDIAYDPLTLKEWIDQASEISSPDKMLEIEGVALWFINVVTNMEPDFIPQSDDLYGEIVSLSWSEMVEKIPDFTDELRQKAHAYTAKWEKKQTLRAQKQRETIEAKTIINFEKRKKKTDAYIARERGRQIKQSSRN